MDSLSISTPIPTPPPTMSNRLLSFYTTTLQHLLSLYGHLHASLSWLYRKLTFHVHPFWHHLFYLLSLAFLGSLILTLLDDRKSDYSPKYLDLLFMSISALTVSGLNSVELEVFSTAQVMVLTLLMLAGGEVFLSLLGLVFRSQKTKLEGPTRVDPVDANAESALELGRPDSALELAQAMKYRCLPSLVHVVLYYHVTFHAAGAIAIALYLRYTPSARGVLKARGLPLIPFAITVTVSSFANGGLIPTNENMLIFLKNSGLLLTIVVLVLAGNTLFSSLLRVTVSVLYRLTQREEYGYMLRNPEKLSFDHLLPKRQTLFVAASVGGFWVAQFVVYLSMEWKKSYLDGLSSFQRIVSGVFQASNSRHCGENCIDVSQVSAAVSAIFIVSMFLPAYSSFQPFESERDVDYSRRRGSEKGTRRWLKLASLPQISYIVIFVLIICIVERKRMSNDPLNFSFLFVTFEVVSAYGNVGYSTGYACSRQLHADSSCKDMWVSLSGKWSNAGKLMIMFVMLFGRLKRFHLGGGKAWRI